jgi:NAD(P)-dependent dehydrogenase (short-subunit alcohol dehydrogenase family)
MAESENRIRTALVTGSAKRIGEAIARGLAADGWNVAVHYNRSADSAARLVQDLRARGSSAMRSG